MDKATKNQETGMRELNQEELKTIDGGVTYVKVIVDGKEILITIDN